jgi:hypothetical protein
VVDFVGGLRIAVRLQQYPSAGSTNQQAAPNNK